ncbi:acyltransferase domain-containing protein, partial [Actinomadura chokoriensis]
MGRELYDRFSDFAEELDAVCDCLDARLDHPIKQTMFAGKGSSNADLLDQTAFTQAALFAIEVALFRLVKRWGVAPDFLAGHSIGEVAAAHVAGVLSLQDACDLVVARGRLMQALPCTGAMVALEASETEVSPQLVGREQQVSIAAVNGPSSVVISGDEHHVSEIAALWGKRGRRVKRLRVSHAFHSPYMDSMLDAFRKVVESLTFHPPMIPIVSNVTGELLRDEEACSPEYWVRHVRQPVRFYDAMISLQTRGVSTFIELGPGGALTAMIQNCLTDAHTATAALAPVLRPDRSETRTLLNSLGEVFVRGGAVDWEAVFPGRPSAVQLPTYAFQRKRYWLET